MKEIGLSNGGVALVDDEDYERLIKHKWRRDKGGYAIATVSVPGSYHPITAPKAINYGIKMHRVIMDAPKGKEVDHINHNKLDNRKENLRLCRRNQNRANTLPKRKTFKGVRYDSRYGSWYSCITVKSKYYHLGTYPSVHLAALAYDLWAIFFFGEYAYTNFPVVIRKSNSAGRE